ncbi:MAG TPA: VIT domain-containing protein [Gemmatimonadales bacterium]
MSARRLFGVVCAVVLPIAPAPSAAQGWIEHPRGAIEKVRSAVQVNVTGRVARVTVEEWFRNTGALLNEANYLYPLPGETVFSDFSLWQGDQELKGEPMDAAQARAIYEEIVRRKRDPALIELAGHGLLRARVFPIGPGETRKITLRYTEMLDRVGDAWRFRYTAGSGAGAAASASFRMRVDSAARFGDPYSPTHRLSTTRSDNRIELTLADTTTRGDLELFLPLARSLVGMSLVTSQPLGEDGFFMLLLAPGSAAQAPAVRRDLVAVLDVSGSMSGDKLDQAKTALAQLLGTLRSGDRFRVVTFGSGVRRYATGWTDVSGDNVRAVQEWVRRLDTDGGTNIAGALAEAFAEPPAEGRLGVVVFLTDGMATVGEKNPERLADQAERDRGPFRVFAFGIGYDVNTYLLDRLTERARGVTEYIRPGGDIEQAVASLASKVASPVLTDLALRSDGVELYDLQPRSLPDLFGRDELVVFGRYRGEGRGEGSVTVIGRRGGREERFSTVARFGGERAGADYVQQLWAARKAGALSSEIRLHGPNREIVSELKQLALRYGILTEYTSYLVQEPNVVARPMPLQAPAPQDQAGAEAVQRSRREKALTGSLQLSEVVITGSAADSLSRGGAATEHKTQRAAGRVFVWRYSTWTDIAHGDSVRVVNVAAFSDAYFALLRALPELVQAATLEPAVLVAGRRVSIKIGPDGKTTWTDGELERLVREFHG